MDDHRFQLFDVETQARAFVDGIDQEKIDLLVMDQSPVEIAAMIQFIHERLVARVKDSIAAMSCIEVFRDDSTSESGWVVCLDAGSENHELASFPATEAGKQDALVFAANESRQRGIKVKVDER